MFRAERPLLVALIELFEALRLRRTRLQGTFHLAGHVFLRGRDIAVYAGGNGGEDSRAQGAALIGRDDLQRAIQHIAAGLHDHRVFARDAAERHHVIDRDPLFGEALHNGAGAKSGGGNQSAEQRRGVGMLLAVRMRQRQRIFGQPGLVIADPEDELDDRRHRRARLGGKAGVGEQHQQVEEEVGGLGHQSLAIVGDGRDQAARAQTAFEQRLTALAAERGVEATIDTASESPNHRSVVDVRGVAADGSSVNVAGTLSGPQQVEKIVQVNDRNLDLRAEGVNLIINYSDQPGALGKIGTLLGGAGVNILAAQLSQDADGDGATIMLRLDRPVDADVLSTIGTEVDAATLELVDLL